MQRARSERRARVGERTCVGCGTRRTKGELLRYVENGETVVLDPLQRALQRGVYVCPRRWCLERAVKRRGFCRSLRRGVAVSPAAHLAEAAAASLVEAARELVHGGVRDGRARHLAVGEDISPKDSAVVPQGVIVDRGTVMVNDERLGEQLGTLVEQLAGLRGEVQWPLRSGTLK